MELLSFHNINLFAVCLPDVLLVVDVLLGSVDDADDAEFDGDDASTQDINGISTFDIKESLCKQERNRLYARARASVK